MNGFMPVGPLIEALDDYCHLRNVSVTDAAAHFGMDRRTYYKWLSKERATIRWDVADRIAVQLGYHPGSLWPEEWFS